MTHLTPPVTDGEMHSFIHSFIRARQFLSHVRLANIGQSRDWVTLWAIANVAGKQRARAFIDVLLFSMPVFCQLRSLCLWHLSTCTCTRMHDEVKKVNVVDLYSASTRSVSKALRYIYIARIVKG